MSMDTWEDGSIHQLEVSFVSGLNPHQRKTYTLDDSGQAMQDDGMLQVVTEGDDVVFSSPLVAVKIPSQTMVYPDDTRAHSVPAPIRQVRGKAKWYGRGWLDADMGVKERAMKVVEDGPIRCGDHAQSRRGTGAGQGGFQSSFRRSLPVRVQF
jgi:hypothetical protein